MTEGPKILDSGERRSFATGGVRDIAVGKGRCDLMPIKEVAMVLKNVDKNLILNEVDKFMKSGDSKFLTNSIQLFVVNFTEFSLPAFMIEVAKHYEEGALKYGERNWEKGLPLHCYIDSGVRHYLKHLDGKREEPHDRAFVWNMLGAIWTMENRPSLIDIDFKLLGTKR